MVQAIRFAKTGGPEVLEWQQVDIGKPGPGSISEAVAMKLPVIIERNSWTLPQERYNADWVKERQAGMIKVHDPTQSIGDSDPCGSGGAVYGNEGDHFERLEPCDRFRAGLGDSVRSLCVPSRRKSLQPLLPAAARSAWP